MNSGVDGKRNYSFPCRNGTSGPSQKKILRVNDVQWRVCRVTEALPDDDGLVRTVRVEVGTENLSSNGKRKQPLSSLERPVHKLLLMCAQD